MDWKSKHVLVTGACGFLGQNLTHRLSTLGATLICVDNFSLGRKGGFTIPVNEIDCEFLTVNGELDYVFHFGAPCSIIQFNQSPIQCLRNTIHGFSNILHIAEHSNAKLIYPSSGNVYGATLPPQNENVTPNPTNLYAIAKLTCEKMASHSFASTVGLRIFLGYGPGEAHKGEVSSVVSLFLSSMFRGERPVIYGDGLQERDFVYVGDIVEACVRTAERDTPPILNVGSGVSYNFNQLVEACNLALGTNIQPVYVSKPAGYVEKARADTTLMEQTLGFQPISLEAGLRKYVRYLRGDLEEPTKQRGNVLG